MIYNKFFKKLIFTSSLLLYVSIAVEYFVLFPNSKNVMFNTFICALALISSIIVIYVEISFNILKDRSRINTISLILTFCLLFFVFLPEILYKNIKYKYIIYIILMCIFFIHLLVIQTLNKSLSDSGNNVCEEILTKNKIIEKVKYHSDYKNLCHIKKVSIFASFIYLIIGKQILLFTLILILGAYYIWILKKQKNEIINLNKIIILSYIFSSILTAVLLFFGLKMVSWISFCISGVVIANCAITYLNEFEKNTEIQDNM